MNGKLKTYQRLWTDQGLIEGFARKNRNDFFKSETELLAGIIHDVHSVLDIGCASGRLFELVRHFQPHATFSGIDLVPESIERARAAYPTMEFRVGDALSMEIEGHYDLVNATGVCQHEPRFETLIERMLDWSRRWVLFDVKLGAESEHLCDLDRAWCELRGGGKERDQRLYFIILHYPAFRHSLLKLSAVKSIRIFGYPTKPNSLTTVPNALAERIVSAGVLIEKARSVDHASIPSIVETLPDGVPRNESLGAK